MISYDIEWYTLIQWWFCNLDWYQLILIDIIWYLDYIVVYHRHPNSSRRSWGCSSPSTWQTQHPWVRCWLSWQEFQWTSTWLLNQSFVPSGTRTAAPVHHQLLACRRAPGSLACLQHPHTNFRRDLPVRFIYSSQLVHSQDVKFTDR